VGKNFDEITGDKSTHTLAYIGAPWCGHCKALAPTWKKLAGMFKDDRSKLNVARMDGTENEVASVEVKGFPTIVYFGLDGEPTPYSGGRDLDALVAFVEEKTGTLKSLTRPSPHFTVL
jgi:protein disulfide-isomerase-like protein